LDTAEVKKRKEAIKVAGNTRNIVVPRIDRQGMPIAQNAAMKARIPLGGSVIDAEPVPRAEELSLGGRGSQMEQSPRGMRKGERDSIRVRDDYEEIEGGGAERSR
jgi:hypothetical protein